MAKKLENYPVLYKSLDNKRYHLKYVDLYLIDENLGYYKLVGAAP